MCGERVAVPRASQNDFLVRIPDRWPAGLAQPLPLTQHTQYQPDLPPVCGFFSPGLSGGIHSALPELVSHGDVELPGLHLVNPLGINRD